MSNSEKTNPAEDFDLFATPVDNHLAEELEKGTFQWTNKYTKILGVLTAIVALLSVGAWYGHRSAASSSTTTNFSALRAAFAGRTGSSGGFGGGSGSSGFSGGGGGGFGGFGTRITGTISKVSGGTVTITLNDPTQASSLTAGDNARVTDTGAGAAAAPAGAAPGGVPATGGTTGGTTTRKSFGKGSGSTGSATTGGTATSPSGTQPGQSGQTGQGGQTRGGGLFNNPAFTACLTKAGVTITPGQRPNFQDPTTMTAIQGCMKSLGITFGGGAGGGGGGFGGNRGGSAGGSAAGGSSSTSGSTTSGTGTSGN